MEANILYILAGLVSIVGAFKAVDWLISTKYKTKDDCEKCRSNIFDVVNKDRELLVRVDTKMDLVLKQLKISIKEK